MSNPLDHPYHIGQLHYRTRDLGYGTEEETDEVYFTGEVDTWGKYTVISVNRAYDETYYLFPDEIIDWTPYPL